MPSAALRPCGAPGCPCLVRSGRCDQHGGERKAWRSVSVPPPERLNGHQNHLARMRLFQREPLCRPCAAKGVTTLATIRDHILPLAWRGTEDESNEQPICEPCHRVKSRNESNQGVRRRR